MSLFFAASGSGLVWMGVFDRLGWGSFVFGALFGLVLWRLLGARSRRPFGPLRALRLVYLGSRLGLYFLWELIVANAQQLRIVLAGRIDIRPGWIHFRTELEGPAMRALLGTMMSLTPGTLTYQETVLEDGEMEIGLHVLDLRDEARLLRLIRHRFEAPLHEMENV